MVLQWKSEMTPGFNKAISRGEFSVGHTIQCMWNSTSHYLGLKIMRQINKREAMEDWHVIWVLY